MVLKETTYTDSNLQCGEYEYFVIVHDTNGCVSDMSNIVTARVLGVSEISSLENIRIYQNPTTGKLEISHI